MLDDVRDLEALPLSLGKLAGGADAANNVLTWPILDWLGDHENAASALSRLQSMSVEARRAELVTTGALLRARAFAASELARARSALQTLPDSAGRAWLHDLCEVSA